MFQRDRMRSHKRAGGSSCARLAGVVRSSAEHEPFSQGDWRAALALRAATRSFVVFGGSGKPGNGVTTIYETVNFGGGFLALLNEAASLGRCP